MIYIIVTVTFCGISLLCVNVYKLLDVNVCALLILSSV